MVDIMNDDLSAIVAELGELNGELAQAVTAGDGRAVELALARLAALERRRNRAVNGTNPMRAEFSVNSVRDRVTAALNLIGRPAPNQLVVSVAKALFVEPVPAGNLAALRRDEQRSWVKAQEVPPRAQLRDAYVVPTLSFDRFAPVRGVLALSSWEPILRFASPTSSRVDFLAAQLNLVSEARHVPTDGLLDVIRTLARTLRGVTFDLVNDLDWIQQAAEGELAKLVARDHEARESAVERARRQLDDEQFLFGVVTSTSARRTA